jgi:hypothetical protein
MLLAPLFAAAQTSKATPSTLRALFVQDQRDRGVALAGDGVSTLSKEEASRLPEYGWPAIAKRDEERRSAAKAILARETAPTGEDMYYAAFIFQHGQAPDDYLLAHVYATEAIVLGYTKAKWISAATLDRYLQSIGQKQVFGTQFSDEKWAYYMQHRNSPDLKEKLKSIGDSQTLEPYDEQLIPDTIRASFCVPSLAAQRQHIANARTGKEGPEDLPRLDECRRQ